MATSQQDSDSALQRIGSGIIKDVASIVAASVLYGIYLILICFSVKGILQKGWKGRASLFQLLATVALFVIASFLWAENFGVLVKRIQFALIDTTLGTIDQRLDLANLDPVTRRLRAMNDVMFVFEYIIGDLLIVWRVWILYSRATIIGLSLFILWLAVFVTGMGFVICDIKTNFARFLDQVLTPHSGTCINLGSSSWPLSLVLNLVATVMLGRIIWMRRSAFRRIGGRHIVRTSRVDRVLSILVAASTVYMILGMLRLAIFGQATEPRVAFFIEVVEYMTEIIVAMYPTAVFVFVLNEGQLSSHEVASFNASNIRLPSTAFTRPNRGLAERPGPTPSTDFKPDQPKGIMVTMDEVVADV
ncbi:hypothetical protein EXIGLDRAFT_844185 [Exidia glandulosa HHB12029]|uniref:Family A G protein-coupled receptor-like protein n=1 Tax=Exidia glandulosa HHB12029 TaxID=1314781 RepID=A0A165C743_EXIGL|nr:hypothetical protein EXIGLDRAFT_844185 [Exidia glandulosa HHB12029]